MEHMGLGQYEKLHRTKWKTIVNLIFPSFQGRFHGKVMRQLVKKSTKRMIKKLGKSLN